MEKSSGKLYWYSVRGALIEETDLSGNLISDYVFFSGARVARRDASGSVYYYFADHLHSARVMTDSTGHIQQESDYYPFGGERVITNTVDNRYKFTGKERDAESGLDHTLHRQYASSTGRWLSPDPAGLAAAKSDNPQSWNRYAYVLNDPATFTDPTGLVLFPGGGGIGGFCDPFDPFSCGPPPRAILSPIGSTITIDDTAEIHGDIKTPKGDLASILKHLGVDTIWAGLGHGLGGGCVVKFN